MNSSAILRLVRTGILVGGLIFSSQPIRAADLIWTTPFSPPSGPATGSSNGLHPKAIS
ncbi:MAG: hypothetical protein NTW21_00185 [Verrucomicrobia bacterium]|nr:hypothetical protein [Verrucomicrobiota bacterium]